MLQGNWNVATKNEIAAAKIITCDCDLVYVPNESMVIETEAGGRYLAAYVELCSEAKTQSTEEQLEFNFDTGQTDADQDQ